MRKIGLFFIFVYQNFFWALLSAVGVSSSCCFIPSCSEYTKEAIIKYGLAKGSWLGINRIMRCWGCKKHTHDPLS